MSVLSVLGAVLLVLLKGIGVLLLVVLLPLKQSKQNSM